VVGEVAFAFAAGMMLAVLLSKAYARRRSAEDEADGYLRELIGMDPDRFWPAGD